MKKSILLFASMLIGTIVFGIVFYRFSMILPLKQSHIYAFWLVLLVMTVSVIISFFRLRDEMRGIPPDDEMSQTVSNRAAFDSFPYSISMWITILILSIGKHDPILPICMGIIGMALIYGGFWWHYKRMGITHD